MFRKLEKNMPWFYLSKANGTFECGVSNTNFSLFFKIPCPLKTKKDILTRLNLSDR